MKRKIFAIAMSLCLLLSMMPSMIFAEVSTSQESDIGMKVAVADSGMQDDNSIDNVGLVENTDINDSESSASSSIMEKFKLSIANLKDTMLSRIKNIKNTIIGTIYVTLGLKYRVAFDSCGGSKISNQYLKKVKLQ